MKVVSQPRVLREAIAIVERSTWRERAALAVAAGGIGLALGLMLMWADRVAQLTEDIGKRD